MDQQTSPDVQSLAETVLKCFNDIPESCRSIITQLGKTMGCFNLEGQVTQLQTLQAQCSQLLESKTKDRDKYVRCYETLGICCGAALVIILL